MASTITLNASSACYGNERQYIARVTGRDSKFTFRREFVGRKSGRSTEATVDDPGLYEICDIDKKGNKESRYRIIIQTPDGLVSLKAQGDNLDGADGHSVAMGVAKRMHAGEDFAGMIRAEKREDGTYAYRVLSTAAAARADKAQSIDQAVEACWQILQAFPEREAKKVLAALRGRVTPKPVAEPAADAETVAPDTHIETA